MSNKSAFFNNELRRQLRKTWARTLGLRLASGLVTFLALASWVFVLVVLWTASTGNPPLWQTLAVSRAAFGISAGLFLIFIVYPLIRVPGVGKLALAVEGRKDFHDIVAAGYEFSSRDDLSSGYSPTLIREVIRQAVHSVSGLEVRFLFLTRRQLALVPVAYAALIALIITAFASPSALLEAGRRVISPREAAAVSHDANLYASPGDITVLAGSDVEVTALDFGGTENPVGLSYDLSGGFWKTEPTEEGEKLVDGNAPMKQYTYTFESIRNSLTYYFQSGDNKTPEYRITVVNKPIVTDLAIVLMPPAYTGEAPDTLVDSGGNVQALEGTHVQVDARANNDLVGARVRFDGKKTQPIEVDGKEFGFDFAALEDGFYSILLEDERGHTTDEPLVYAIEVYSDNPPVLDVLEPGSDAALPRNLKMDVRFIASDDFGVEKADIYYRKGGVGKFRRNRVGLGADSGKREIFKAVAWNLDEVTLFPGDFIEYFLQVEDNNIVTGPGITKSKMFHITVPTMAELYEKIKEDDGNRSDLFEEAMKESKEFKKQVEKLSREFKKTEELDWSQKKEIDKAKSAQETIQEQLQEIQRSLEETLESLSDNRMTSQEIGEKLEEINRLMEEINNEALEKYMEDLREAMEKLDPRDIQKALENLELSAEDLLKSLERTEALLKEIQKEQEMEELVRKTKDLMDAQDEVSDKTSETDAGDTKEMKQLAEEQESLSDSAEQLEKDLEKFAEELGGDLEDPEMSEQMQKTAEEFSKNDPSQKMRDASSKLQQQQKQDAQQSQQQATDDLIALFTRVVEMQAGMQNGSRRRSAENLQRLARGTLDISFKQENLTERLREQASTSDAAGVRALAEEQLTYVKAVSQVADELDEIAKRTLAVPQALLGLLGETITRMQSSMVFLEQNKAFLSTTSAGQAVTSLNQITIALLSASRNQSCGGGSGSQQMSAMQQMLQGQRQLLQDSKALAEMRAAQEKILQERQAAMRRLAGQQRSLRGLAEDIQKDIKKGDRPLGRMDRIIEEMEEVIRDLEGGVLNEQTLRNQERILSRMLDAQRSVNSRDYEKKRRSITAEDVFSKVPDGADARRTSQMLREEIRRAMALKAPGEFEDLIRLYFRALAEEAPLDSDGK